uniref:DC1 domain-containing protein n=1 Tax=Populus alba TaxID=43335 RepID=A0A4U5NMK0_POPAL|nr:hypothetical protein D5086_0000261890 [Populus alba]
MGDLVAGSASSSQPLQWLAVTLGRSGFGQKQRRLGKGESVGGGLLLWRRRRCKAGWAEMKRTARLLLVAWVPWWPVRPLVCGEEKNGEEGRGCCRLWRRKEKSEDGGVAAGLFLQRGRELGGFVFAVERQRWKGLVRFAAVWALDLLVEGEEDGGKNRLELVRGSCCILMTVRGSVCGRLETRKRRPTDDGESIPHCSGCCVSEESKVFLKCAVCDFKLGMKCATLPYKARHEYDDHPLFLTYINENDYQPSCIICEKDRDPKLWFYRCEQCDFDAHPECALGKYPYFNAGGVGTCPNHPHPLALVVKTEDYAACDTCGEPCDDLALECTDPNCSFIVHRKRECLKSLR